MTLAAAPRGTVRGRGVGVSCEGSRALRRRPAAARTVAAPTRTNQPQRALPHLANSRRAHVYRGDSARAGLINGAYRDCDCFLLLLRSFIVACVRTRSVKWFVSRTKPCQPTVYERCACGRLDGPSFAHSPPCGRMGERRSRMSSPNPGCTPAGPLHYLRPFRTISFLVELDRHLPGLMDVQGDWRHATTRCSPCFCLPVCTAIPLLSKVF